MFCIRSYVLYGVIVSSVAAVKRSTTTGAWRAENTDALHDDKYEELCAKLLKLTELVLKHEKEDAEVKTP